MDVGSMGPSCGIVPLEFVKGVRGPSGIDMVGVDGRVRGALFARARELVEEFVDLETILKPFHKPVVAPAMRRGRVLRWLLK